MIVSKREFSIILKSPFEQAFSIPNIKAGFIKTGLYPLNSDAVAKSKMIPSELFGNPMLCPSNSSESDVSAPPSSLSSGMSNSAISSDSTHSGSPASVPAISPNVSTDAVSPNVSTDAVSPNVSTDAVSPNLSTDAVFPNVSTDTVSPNISSMTASATVSAQTQLSIPHSISNPLVSGCLISPDFIDIIVAPANDAVVMKRSKRITGARHLTAVKHADMLREDKRMKEELEEQKQKRKRKQRGNTKKGKSSKQ